MTNMGMASVRKVHPLFLLGVCHQLLCKRTTAVVRPKIQTVSTTYPISFSNMTYPFQQPILSLPTTYPISSSNITYIYQRQEEGES